MLRVNAKCRIFLYGLLLLIPISFWIYTTQSGLIFSVWLIKPLLSPAIKINTVSGKWNNTISLYGLTYASPMIQLTAEELTLKPSLHTLRASRLKIPYFLLKNAQITFKKLSSPLSIAQAEGTLNIKKIDQGISAQIHSLSGVWFEQPIQATGALTAIHPQLYTLNALIRVGKHSMQIQSNLNENQKLNWCFTLDMGKQLKANLDGDYVYEKNLGQQTLTLTHLTLHSEWIGNWHLKEPIAIYRTAKQAYMQALQLIHASGAIASATFQWQPKQGLKLRADIPTLSLQHPDLQGKTSLHARLQQKPNALPHINLDGIIHPGTFTLQRFKKQPKKIAYQGGAIDLFFNGQALKAGFIFRENAHNFAHGHFNTFPPSPQNNVALLEQPLQGKLVFKASDLKLIKAFFPQVSKLTALLEMDMKFSGTLNQPRLYVQANIKAGACRIPKQGLVIQEVNVQGYGDIPGKLSLSGNGYAGTGQFSINGETDISDNLKTHLKLSGKNLHIYRTSTIDITASPELALDYINHTLFAQGTVRIPNAVIFLTSEKKHALLSKDVILVNNKKEETSRPFKIVPSLYLILENPMHFKGYGLESLIKGELAIDERPDGLLSGSGKLTILDGKYRLQGATRYIHRGYLLFTPGTLLNDPILDIRISNARLQHLQQTPDVGIYVQGTLQKPLFYPYSSDNLRSSEILSRLGFGQRESTNPDQRQLIAQSAFLLSGTANPFIENIQMQLGLEELNLESEQISQGSNHQGGTDTVLVVGKSLSSKLYLQCLQHLLEPITTVKLKYSLSPRLTASIETGTEGPAGDLIFTMERD